MRCHRSINLIMLLLLVIIVILIMALMALMCHQRDCLLYKWKGVIIVLTYITREIYKITNRSLHLQPLAHKNNNSNSLTFSSNNSNSLIIVKKFRIITHSNSSSSIAMILICLRVKYMSKCIKTRIVLKTYQSLLNTLIPCKKELLSK